MHQSVKILNGVQIHGNLNIGRKSSIWYNAVIRGDIEDINIGEYSNIQDNCVLHTSKDFPLNIGSYVSVGHSAVLHGTTIRDNCLIGMNTTLLNGSLIGADSIVGAGAVVTQGKKFPDRSLILGMPAKMVRKLETREVKSIKENALRYAELADEHV